VSQVSSEDIVPPPNPFPATPADPALRDTLLNYLRGE
jgi:hypothetical protein